MAAPFLRVDNGFYGKEVAFEINVQAVGNFV